MNLISQAITHAGGVVSLAKSCGVTYQAVRRWERHNRLPRTDPTGETKYARAIAKATKNLISRYALLKVTREKLGEEHRAYRIQSHRIQEEQTRCLKTLGLHGLTRE